MNKQPVRTNISDLIKTTMGSQFVIPVYQRNYTWNPDTETARFMNDIETLLTQKDENHFLGILITMESTITAMFHQIQIVDGQQRLTTSFIFLVGLKRLAKEKNQMDVAGMIDDYYLYNKHAMEEAKLRLKPTVSDDDVFEKLIYENYQNLSRQEKESNVYANYISIYHRICEFAKKYSLAEILDCLSRVDVLVFPLQEQDNAQQIFESINSTGAPLTSADLIRNYILMNNTNEVQEHYYRLYWQPLENYYPESRRLEEFFRYYLAAKTYNLLNRRDVYEGFKSFWKGSKADCESQLRDINRYCRYYYAIYNGPYEDDEVEEVLKDFRRNESRMPAPFLMEMFRLAEDHEISSKTLKAQIKLVDSYLTRRALCGNDTGAMSRYFPQLLRSVMNTYRKKKRDIHEITKVFLINYNRGKALAMPTDEQLRSQLKEINAYSLMCLRPVLERIEMHDASATVNTDDLNIEHIMPQHPNGYWKKVAKVDDDTYTFYANLIGNLTLCAQYDNTLMGNQDFAFKKKILSKTLHIRMNTEILQKDSWTPQDILKRCDRLAKEIIAIYPYEGGIESKDTNISEKEEETIVLSAPSVSAKAIYHNPQSIEILSGSTMKAYGPQEMKTMRQLFQDMSGKGVLSEDENGLIQFDKNYRFHDLNTAAQFLLHRGGENRSAWTKENGTAFQEGNVKVETAPTPTMKKAKPAPHNKKKPPQASNKPKKGQEPPKKKKPNNKSSKPQPQPQKKKPEANQPKGERLQPQKTPPKTEKKQNGFFSNLFKKKSS